MDDVRRQAGKRQKQAGLGLGVVLPAAFAIVGATPYLLYGGDLPRRLTVVFSISRTPMTSAPAGVVLASLAAIVLAACLTCVVLAFGRRRSGDGRERIGSVAGFFGATSAVLLGGSVWIHRGLDDWTDAIGPGWFILIPIVSGFASAALAERLTAIVGREDRR